MRKVVSILTIIFLFIVSIGIVQRSAIYPVKADELDEIYREKNKKEQELSKLLKDINKISSSSGSLSSRIRELEEKKKQATKLIKDIDSQTNKIVKIIEKKQKDIKATKLKIGEYLAYMYVETQISPVYYVLSAKNMEDFLDRMSVYAILYRDYYNRIQTLTKEQEYYRGQLEALSKQKELLNAKLFQVNKTLGELKAKQKLLQAQLRAKQASRQSLVHEITGLSSRAAQIIARKAAEQGGDSGSSGSGGGSGGGGGGVLPPSGSAGRFTIKDKNGNVLISSVNGPVRLQVEAGGYFEVSPTIYSDRAVLRYRGSLIFRKDSNVYVINKLPLETYLKGLGEIYSWWPIEAAKAQAVAARTYAYASLGKRSSNHYDIYDSTLDQNYMGVDKEIGNWPSAVSQTNGKVIKSGGNFIATYYHSADGGHTLSTQDVWGGYRSYAQAKSDRYLENGQWKSYDNVDSCYTGSMIRRSYYAYANRTITYAWLEDLVDAAIYLARHNGSKTAQNAVINFGFGTIKNVLGNSSISAKVGHINNIQNIYNDGRTSIGEHSKYTKNLKIIGSNGTYTLDAQMFKLAYNLRSPGSNWISSSLFDAKKISDNNWKFYSRGFGHRVGMSQFGACGRATKGQDYITILKAYYSGINFVTVPNKTISIGLTKVGGNITTVKATKAFKIYDGSNHLIKTVNAGQEINIVR